MMNRILFAVAFALLAWQAQAQTGRVTTSAPTYTDATTAPLSLETDGDQRVHDAASEGELEDIEADVEAVESAVDGLEALITTLTAAVDELEAKTDSIITALDGTLTTTIVDGADVALDYTAPASATVASVNDDNDPAQACLDSDATRLGAAFYNDSTATLYLLVDEGTASATNFTVKIAPEGYYELPTLATGVYTDAISCIWSADASGAVRITEWLP